MATSYARTRRQIVHGDFPLTDAERRAIARGEAEVIVDPAGRARAAREALNDTYTALFEAGASLEVLRRVRSLHDRTSKLAADLATQAQRKRRRVPMPTREETA